MIAIQLVTVARYKPRCFRVLATSVHTLYPDCQCWHMPLSDPPLIQVAHWNLHADHRALTESLITRDGEEAQTWYARRDRILGVLVELFAHADVVVTTENNHFWWILHELQKALPDVKGEFCASASPASDTRLKALYTAYGLMQVAHEEVEAGDAPPLSVETCSEICLRAYDEDAPCAYEEEMNQRSDVTSGVHVPSVCPSYQYDVVNAWFHLEQDPRLVRSLTETLGWTSYQEEHVPTQQRPLDRNANDLYVGPDGVGLYWNSAKVQYAATLAHDDAHYVGPLPCNRGGLCGLRLLVLGKDHIVDVFGAQLADGSLVDGTEESYEDGLTRVCRWMHAYDHLHVDQQVACISHVGFRETECPVDSLQGDSWSVTNAPDHHARLVDPPHLRPIDETTSLVDVLPTDHPTTAGCRLRATDGQLTITTLDRVLVRKGRLDVEHWDPSSESDDSHSCTNDDEHHDGDDIQGCSDGNTNGSAQPPPPCLVRPITFRTLSPQSFHLARNWSTSVPSRYAIRNAAMFEEWTDVVGANYVPELLVKTLDGIDHGGAFDVVAEAMYPSPACWSDHPPVAVSVPSRDIAAMRPSTVGAALSNNTWRVGKKRTRRRGGWCGCEDWSACMGVCASACAYVLHTHCSYSMTSGPMLTLGCASIACFVHTVGQL